MRSLETPESSWLKHRESLSVFDAVGEAGTPPVHLVSDELRADEVLARHQEEGTLGAVIAGMPIQLAQILRRRFGLDGADPETLAQIGTTMRLSRERIRQLEKKALTAMRQKLDEVAAVAA